MNLIFTKKNWGGGGGKMGQYTGWIIDQLESEVGGAS